MAPGEDKLNRGSESSTGFCFPPNLLEGWPHESLGIPGTPWLGKQVQEQVQGIPPRNRVHGRGLLCIFSFHGAPPAISSRSKHATCVGMWRACTLSASEMYAVKNEHSEPSTDKDLLWVHLGTLFKLGGKKKKRYKLESHQWLQSGLAALYVWARLSNWNLSSLPYCLLSFSPGLDLLFPSLHIYLLQLNCFNKDICSLSWQPRGRREALSHKVRANPKVVCTTAAHISLARTRSMAPVSRSGGWVTVCPLRNPLPSENSKRLYQKKEGKLADCVFLFFSLLFYSGRPYILQGF